MTVNECSLEIFIAMPRIGIVLLYLCSRKSRKRKSSMKGMVELCYDMPQWETYLGTSEVAFSEVQKVQLKNELHDFLNDACWNW